jgi:hypothetical protein
MNRNGVLFSWALILPFFLSGCFSTVRTATRAGTDFGRIKSVLVLEPEYAQQRAVTDEFARQLLMRGYQVKVGGPAEGSDAWLQITVTQFVPDAKYLVPLETSGNRQTLVLNAVTEISGRTVYPSMTGAGIENARILVSNATLSLSARLLAPQTQELLWSGAVTYEGLDLDVALEGSVASLFKKFPLQ